MNRFMVSFRHESHEVVKKLQLALEAELGAGRLHLYPDFQLGPDFRRLIAEALEQCLAVLVIVDEHWLRRVPDLLRRNDWVRLEISSALGGKVPTIPLFVDVPAELPSPDVLPEELQDFCFCNGYPLNTDATFASNVAELVRKLKRLEGAHRWAETRLETIRTQIREAAWDRALETCHQAMTDAVGSAERRNTRRYAELERREPILGKLADAHDACKCGSFTQARQLLEGVSDPSARAGRELSEIALAAADAARKRDKNALRAQRLRLSAAVKNIHVPAPGQAEVAAFVSLCEERVAELVRLQREMVNAYRTACTEGALSSITSIADALHDTFAFPRHMADDEGDLVPGPAQARPVQDTAGAALATTIVPFSHRSQAEMFWRLKMPASVPMRERTNVAVEQRQQNLQHELWQMLTAPSIAVDQGSSGSARTRILDYSVRRKRSAAVTLPNLSHLQFTVTAPTLIRHGSTVTVTVWAHPVGEQSRVIADALKHSGDGAPSAQPSSGESLLELRLDVDPHGLHPVTQGMVPYGDSFRALLSYACPPTAGAGLRQVSADVFLDGLKISKLLFSLEVGEMEEPVGFVPLAESRALNAYAAYDERDRDIVEPRLQRFAAAVPGLAINDACLSLRRQAGWTERMKRVITRHQYFYLFWSGNAAGSAELDAEWRAALGHGAGFISTVSLDGSAPPPELQHLRFHRWDQGMAT